MKKDRNCGGNMYPNYQMNGMMPMQGGMPPMPYPAPMPGPMNNYPMMGSDAREFLKTLPYQSVIDIKYSISHFSDTEGQVYSYSAMIIYEA